MLVKFGPARDFIYCVVPWNSHNYQNKHGTMKINVYEALNYRCNCERNPFYLKQEFDYITIRLSFWEKLVSAALIAQTVFCFSFVLALKLSTSKIGNNICLYISPWKLYWL